MGLYKPISRYDNIVKVNWKLPDREGNRRFIGINRTPRFNRNKQVIGYNTKIYLSKPNRRHK